MCVYASIYNINQPKAGAPLCRVFLLFFPLPVRLANYKLANYSDFPSETIQVCPRIWVPPLPIHGNFELNHQVPTLPILTFGCGR